MYSTFILFPRFVLSELASSERDYVEKLEHCIEVSVIANWAALPCHVIPRYVIFV